MTKPDLSLAFTPLTLPNGQVLKNRIAKAPMEENLASASLYLAPSPQLIKLYQTWADGGSGLIISGNVMIDYQAVGGVAPISSSRELVKKVKEDHVALKAFHDWVSAATSKGAQFWIQLNHPGRQAFAPAATKILGPSSTAAVDVGRVSKHFFSVPKEMTENEIMDVIGRFAEGAQFAESIGASGVEIHSANGYLLNQFLSPLNNERKDKWGGTLENRAKFLFEVVKATLSVVSSSFAVAIKLNSADFQRGGFSQDDAQWVIGKLNDFKVEGRGLDLIEISGGNFESPAMSGHAKAEKGVSSSTMAREAYFLDFAHRITSVSTLPIMVTGGISRAEIVAKVVSPAPGQTVDNVRTVAGLATALALLPDLPNRLLRGEDPIPAITAGPSFFLPSNLISAAKLRQVQYSIRAIGDGKPPAPGVSPLWALANDHFVSMNKIKQYKKLIARCNEV